jgi:hypothetical protein
MDPCFKPGPCPCADPCKWVFDRTPLAGRPDDKLIRLCAEFLDVAGRLAHIDERMAGNADEKEAEDLKAETEPLLLRHDRLLEPIAALNARTYLGRRMKASAAFAAMRTIEEMVSDDVLALVRSALRDVAGLAQEVPV